jgi:hypothetical protein
METVCFKPSLNKRWVAQRKRVKTKYQTPGGIIFHSLSESPHLITTSTMYYYCSRK